MSDERATVVIDKNKADKYSCLTIDENSIFYGHSKTDVFIASAAIGYYFKKRIPITPSDKQDLFVTTTLGEGGDNKLWLMKSIAISQTDISILKSMKEIVKICQEFANYGIDYLYDLHTKTDNELMEIVEIMADIVEN